MSSKKGKGKGKNTKEEPSKPTKSQYLAKIAELNAVLAETRKETYEVEEIYFNAEKTYDQTQEDMADVVKYLEHEIQVCEDEIAVYDSGIAKHSKELDEQEKYYKEIFSRMEQEYEEKKLEMKEKIESVNVRGKTMKEVRRQMEEFQQKKAEMMKAMEETSQRHKEEIYDAEKQEIIEQDKLQKEMERRLIQLAVDLQEATEVRIGETTNNIIGENIKLGNKLTCQQEYLEKLTSEYQTVKKHHYETLLDLELKEEECNMTFAKYAEYEGRIDELLRAIDAWSKKIEELKKLIKNNRKMKRKIREMECFMGELEVEYYTIVNSLEQMEKETAKAKANLRHFQQAVAKLQLSLFDVAQTVKQAIDCENFVENEFDKTQKSDSGESPFKKESLSVMIEAEKENMYRKRHSLIEDVITQLQNEILNTAELHLLASSADLFEFTTSYRSSIGDRSTASRRSIRQADPVSGGN